MHIVAIIAARMESTRFPGKPLVRIGGMPMIGHVYHRARLATELNDLWIATCDESILDYAASIGAPAVMTQRTHDRGTERIAEAVPLIERQTGKRIDVAVLVPGDEPMLVPSMLDELLAPMRRDGIQVANLTSPSAEEPIRTRSKWFEIREGTPSMFRVSRFRRGKSSRARCPFGNSWVSSRSLETHCRNT